MPYMDPMELGFSAFFRTGDTLVLNCALGLAIFWGDGRKFLKNNPYVSLSHFFTQVMVLDLRVSLSKVDFW